VGIEPSSPWQTRKLFIPRFDKSYKIGRNAEVRYTAGTRTESKNEGFSGVGGRGRLSRRSMARPCGEWFSGQGSRRDMELYLITGG
jgi:hypothetical protein